MMNYVLSDLWNTSKLIRNLTKVYGMILRKINFSSLKKDFKSIFLTVLAYFDASGGFEAPKIDFFKK